MKGGHAIMSTFKLFNIKLDNYSTYLYKKSQNKKRS